MKRLKAQYGCGVELSLDLLGGKWKSVLLARLKDRPLRYGELRALVPGMSDKMLTQRLKELRAIGLVRVQQRGRHSQYVLSTRAEGLRSVLQGLYNWGESMAAEQGVTLAGSAAGKRARREVSA